MYYPLDELEVIPGSALQQLAASGIHNTNDLLDRAATPHDRQRLAQETGLSTHNLAHWAAIADLLRIKPIQPGWAELLVSSGLVGNVQQFLSALGVEGVGRKRDAGRIAEREQVHAAASDLVKQLKTLAAQSSIEGRIPGVRELAEAAEEAAELRPRLALAAPDDGEEEFRQRILTQARERWRYSTKRRWTVTGILAALSVLVTAISLVVLYNRLGPLSAGGDSISNLRNQLAGTTMSCTLQSMGILVVMFLALQGALLAMYDLFMYLLNTRFAFWLFNDLPYRALYRKVTGLSLERRQRASWWSYAALMAIVLGLLLNLYFKLDQVDWTDEEVFQSQLRALALPVALGGVLAGVIACVPESRFYLRELRVDPDADDAGIQRYLIFRLSKLAFVPLTVVLLAQVGLPGLFQVHAHIYRSYIMPRFRDDVLEIRHAITALDLGDEASQHRRERLLDYVDEMVADQLMNYSLLVTEEERGILDFGIPLALNAAVWVLFTYAALLFVLPYFVLVGWRKGLFYMIMLAVAFATEGALQESAPTWFSLEPQSVGSLVIIALVVFANALFFDWLFGMLTERVKVCPGCRAQLDVEDAHCAVCGLIQP